MLPQLFLTIKNSRVVAVLSKIFEDLILAGHRSLTNPLAKSINHKFPLGTVRHGPGLIRFFGLNVRHFGDFSITVDGDDKLDALNNMQLSLCCRRDADFPLNSIESKAFGHSIVLSAGLASLRPHSAPILLVECKKNHRRPLSNTSLPKYVA